MRRNEPYLGSHDGFKEILHDGTVSNYKINESGEMISFNWGKWFVFNPSVTNRGYYLAVMVCNKRKYSRFVHQLVGIYFIENPNGYTQINHKDCNKLNNHVSNLEWCTSSENLQHAYDNGLIDLTKRKGKFRKREIGKYFAGILLKTYPSMSDASKNGFPLGSLNRALGDGRTCKGFNWKYIDQ